MKRLNTIIGMCIVSFFLMTNMAFAQETEQKLEFTTMWLVRKLVYMVSRQNEVKQTMKVTKKRKVRKKKI